MGGAQHAWCDPIAGKQLPDFLPGPLLVRLGTPADYRGLQRFHYRACRPATWARVICIDYRDPAGATSLRRGACLGRGTACRRPKIDPHQTCETPCRRCARVVGVGVLSWPTAVSKPRQEVFRLDVHDYGAQVRWANQNVRTISRVIVHPQFRGLGLARLLVERLCAICPTRYVEARAAMASVHPMFQRAGLRRHDCPNGAAYFWKELPAR